MLKACLIIFSDVELLCGTSFGPPAKKRVTGEVEIMDKTLEEHVCAAKCGKGCIGPHCFCEGYAGKAGASTLCLPKQLCAEACDAVTGCPREDRARPSLPPTGFLDFRNERLDFRDGPRHFESEV